MESIKQRNYIHWSTIAEDSVLSENNPECECAFSNVYAS